MGAQRPSEGLNELGQTRVRLGASQRCVAEAMRTTPGRVSFLEARPLATWKVGTMQRYLAALYQCTGARVSVDALLSTT